MILQLETKSNKRAPKRPFPVFLLLLLLLTFDRNSVQNKLHLKLILAGLNFWKWISVIFTSLNERGTCQFKLVLFLQHLSIGLSPG